MTVIYAILIFCLLIFVHEFGHFFVAKACDVKVNEFAIGMGPAIWKREKGETKYSVRVFPIGGYCAMEGEDEDSDDPRAFNRKPVWQRALVLAAGSFMNLLTCVVLLIIIAFWAGTLTTTLDRIAPGSPAEAAGLQAGDTIVAIDGRAVSEWSEVIMDLNADAKGGDNTDKRTVEITVLRDGKTMSFSCEPEYDREQKRYMIGIQSTSEHHLIDSFGAGIRNTGQMTVMMVSVLKQLFTGEVSVRELSGPVGIVYAVNTTAKSGVMYVVYLTALLSLNLAIINMIPLPALDGGRLLFLLIRRITGKRVTDEMEGRIHFIGIMLLMLLMVYVTFNDVIRFILPIF